MQSLDTLVRKELIDVDPNGKYYSIHPLIYSFITVKARDRDFENILNSSKICFCRYHLLLFERLNDDFLAGKSVDNPQLEDVIENLSAVMHQSLINDSENAHLVFRILSKAEIFFLMFHIPSCAGFSKLFHIAVQKSTRKSNDFTYLKLYASSYFRNIAFSFKADLDHLEIPEDSRKEIDQLSDGTAAKLSCYEGILKICTIASNVQNGIKQVERSLGGLQSCPDHLLLKCLCLQVLTLYYNNQNELEKSCKFREMAAKVCMEIGNSNLFLIGECDFLLMSKSSKVGVDEPLILFGYLLARWSQTFFRRGISTSCL